MGVAHRRLDRSVTERLLHQSHVAGCAQELGGKIMPIIVKAEADNARAPAQPTPIVLHAAIGEWIALALHPAALAALADIGEGEILMVPAQRPQDIADRRRDLQADALVALAELNDLARGPIDFGPAQEALVEPPAGRLREGKERRVVVTHDGVELVGLVVG